MSASPIQTTSRNYVNTTYKLCVAGKDCRFGWYSPEDYSKYYDRLRMYDKHEIAYEDIYGLQQAMEHARELKTRNKGDEYDSLYQTQDYDIIKTVSVVEETTIPFKL